MSTIDIISSLLAEQGKKQKDLTDYLGLDNTTFSQWKIGKSKSYRKYLKEIASFFNVSVDYLFPEEDTITVSELFTSGSVLEDAKNVIDKIEIAPHQTVKDDLKNMVNGLSDEDAKKLYQIGLTLFSKSSD